MNSSQANALDKLDNKFVSLILFQLIEKAEAREKERLKEEARKVGLSAQPYIE